MLTRLKPTVLPAEAYQHSHAPDQINEQERGIGAIADEHKADPVLSDFVTLVRLDIIHIAADKRARRDPYLHDVIHYVKTDGVADALQLASLVFVKSVAYDVKLLDEIFRLKLDHASEKIPL